MAAKHRPYIKADKLNRICSIYWEDSITPYVTPEEFKPTLNMFQGQQLTRETVRECLNYLHTSLLAQAGNAEAIETLDSIHILWNA